MIEYLKGNAVYPSKYDSNKMNLILQINNDIGAYGAGFSGALSKRWPKVEKSYREWFYFESRSKSSLDLGEIQTIEVEDGLFVINMVAQKNIGLDKNEKPPIRYDALNQCLFNLNKWIKSHMLNQLNCESILIHLPRIGAGLAGGKWSIIEAFLNENLGNYQMYVYDL